jgi:hypothetical protein
MAHVEHASVLSMDEKSQIQALDQKRPGMPMKRAAAARWPRTQVEWRRSTPRETEAAVPRGKAIRAIVENHPTHKRPEAKEWVARHPRWTSHFAPTSSSWLNAIEGFLAKFTTRRLKRGVFGSGSFRRKKNPQKIFAVGKRGIKC